jgi:transcription elongation factor Elf1
LCENEASFIGKEKKIMPSLMKSYGPSVSKLLRGEIDCVTCGAGMQGMPVEMTVGKSGLTFVVRCTECGTTYENSYEEVVTDFRNPPKNLNYPEKPDCLSI